MHGKGKRRKAARRRMTVCVETMDWMTASNKTQTARFTLTDRCSDQKFQNQSSQLGLTCDMFRPPVPGSTILARHCFCHADLCNYMLPVPTLATTTTAEVSSTQATNDASLITGFSTLLQLLLRLLLHSLPLQGILPMMSSLSFSLTG
ncbi:hypothetical protein Ocin01_18192 [Orchesella cincta]|uniref:Uncharacterized protein n=1 Tax=Orchesella cincta TaxID=48709 RepID=A0A1D2M691_ORCCI|nr:hypothetical protein Ocin01_18192 [Orchesella cincta]